MTLMIGLSKLQPSLAHPFQRTHNQNLLFQENILRFEVAMYQPRLVQQTERIKQLLRKHPNQRRTQSAELILLDELVEVDTQKLKDQT